MMNDEISISEYHKSEYYGDSGVKNESLDSGRKSNDTRLEDIEEQLEMAETRCNTLKDQLDQMKHMYGSNKAKTRKISTISSIYSSTSVDDHFNIIPSKKSLPRQKSNAIGTDNSGAAVRTINNILNGITNSVNRLSEIHSQFTTPRPRSTTDSDKHNTHKDVGTDNLNTLIIPELQIESQTTLNVKARNIRKKTAKIRTTSQITFKKPSKIEKKPRTSCSRTSAMLEKKSSTIVRSKIANKPFVKNNNLVEIYHNDAVKHSDSDESNMKRSRQLAERKEQKISYEIPPLQIAYTETSYKDAFSEKKDSPKTCCTYQNELMQEYDYDPPQAPRTMSCYSKNYELPTVASKMKQVAKRYLGTLNLKTIPFCAAISTTQSHNIGINIQQVMNIIKNRQSINGISPTLAHNIGLAAEKMHCKPFSALVSTINSRISQTASRCPLSKTYLNIQQLQEQARSIPEETIEEVDEETVESPEGKILSITGPSGDMEIKAKNLPVWSMDKNGNSEQCTCINPSSVTFQQVVTRYRNNRTLTENNLSSQQFIRNSRKSTVKAIKCRSSKNINSITQSQTIQKEESEKENLFKGREKNLKEVLTNLHNDFESLNKRYEELCERSTIETNEETLKELERLEAELNKKEEEITMVMSLYKEVLALKQQVKQLKEKRSQVNVSSKNTKTKFKEYNNPEAAFHLTKLLKQIQHYQMRYKSNLR